VIIVICNICGNETLNESHAENHLKFLAAAAKCGYSYTYAERERIKRARRAQLSNKSLSLSQRIEAAEEVMKILFFRNMISLEEINLAIPEKTYFAKLLHQKSFFESFGEDVHAVLVKRYGSLPGLEDGQTHQRGLHEV
jgi:hypothetical protein